jgi:hypothetical protein
LTNFPHLEHQFVLVTSAQANGFEKRLAFEKLTINKQDTMGHRNALGGYSRSESLLSERPYSVAAQLEQWQSARIMTRASLSRIRKLRHSSDDQTRLQGSGSESDTKAFEDASIYWLGVQAIAVQPTWPSALPLRDFRMAIGLPSSALQTVRFRLMESMEWLDDAVDWLLA